MSSKRIALNVGGQRFETYVATFTKYPNSLLGRMFSPDNAEMVRPDEKNEYFIGAIRVVYFSVPTVEVANTPHSLKTFKTLNLKIETVNISNLYWISTEQAF